METCRLVVVVVVGFGWEAAARHCSGRGAVHAGAGGDRASVGRRMVVGMEVEADVDGVIQRFDLRLDRDGDGRDPCE